MHERPDVLIAWPQQALPPPGLMSQSLPPHTPHDAAQQAEAFCRPRMQSGSAVGTSGERPEKVPRLSSQTDELEVSSAKRRSP